MTISTEPGHRLSGLDRRKFLFLAGTAALLPAAAAKVVASPLPDVPGSRRRMLQVNASATDAETPLDALTTYITPNDLFFVRHHWNPTYQNTLPWTLAVGGEGGRPLRLHI